jgi:NADPH-dependent F420 reductase
MNVDLPAPFGPVSPYFRPAENVVVTSSKSTFDPNRIDTPWTEIIERSLIVETILQQEELLIVSQALTGAVAILGGTGQQGGGLARRLAHAGASVIVGSRDPDRARETVQDWAAARPIEVADYAGATARAQTTVLAVPFESVDTVLAAIESHFAEGAVVVDVTVPITFAGGKMALVEVPEGSAAEHVRVKLPPHVALACAFKTIPARLLAAIDVPLDCDEFVCGDSDAARARAAALVALLPGLRSVDVGPLVRARSIEHMTALAIAINRRYKVHDARFRVIGI